MASTETKSVSSGSKKPVEDVDLLIEDDEFEEFQQETWTTKETDEDDKQLWEDNWDDDDEVDDDFSKQLRQELEAQKTAAGKK